MSSDVDGRLAWRAMIGAVVACFIWRHARLGRRCSLTMAARLFTRGGEHDIAAGTTGFPFGRRRIANGLLSTGDS